MVALRTIAWIAAACCLAAGMAIAQQDQPQEQAPPPRTLKVGPGEKYAKPSAAIAAANKGDTVEIAPGTYQNDWCSVRRDRLTLRGLVDAEGRKPLLKSSGSINNGKAIWVVSGHNVTVENIDFAGARVKDHNGAGIRAEGRNLTVRGCKFSDCENGILGGGSDPRSEMLIEHCEFAGCGLRGQSHNLYISAIGKLTFRYNYTHRAKEGHLLKSRARENHILYNRIAEEETGSGSYEINLPNGGKAVIMGNVIHQGPKSQNSSMLAYGEEGMKYQANSVYVINNTFINELGKGIFVNIRSRSVEPPVLIANNIFVGRGELCSYPKAELKSNVTDDPQFVDRATWNLHVKADSPCVNNGAQLPAADGVSFVPAFQYVHPCSMAKRTDDGKTVGAYEVARTSRP
ncbi:MAG: right-handed parallel beta-helix repeat-containing protein [Planctomycetaceae bacterium]|nr:right-handed parallel beta-helix repeat-containing protein [Planctomycetaceae bacterium]